MRLTICWTTRGRQRRFYYDICKADNGTHITDGVLKGPNDGGQWNTYEEALEAGIQETLKLI